MVHPFEPLRTSDPDLTEAQARIRDWTFQIGDIAGGKLVTATLGTTQTQVAHGLGRMPRGYLSVGQDSGAVFYKSAAPDAEYLYLTATAPVAVELWVF